MLLQLVFDVPLLVIYLHGNSMALVAKRVYALAIDAVVD